MDGQLTRYIRGAPVARNDQAVTGRAEQVYDDIRLQVFGPTALRGHIMEGAARLDAHRRALAKDGPALNAALTGIELEAGTGEQDPEGHPRPQSVGLLSGRRP